MHNQLIPEQTLQRSKKILFITHLAIGDFTYLQTFFRAFAQKYSHIQVDLWVDEVRRTRLFWRWKGLKQYALYDWVGACSFFNKIYDKTYSPAMLKQSLQQARQEEYDIVVSLTSIRPHLYARFARTIAPKGFVCGTTAKTAWYQLSKKAAFKKLDARLDFSAMPDMKGKHITDHYAYWFSTMFGLELEQSKRGPFVNIPRKWLLFAKLRFLKWGIDKRSNKFSKVFFVNAYAKNEKRCWPIEKVLELIRSFKRDDEWGDVNFIINVMPEERAGIEKFFKKNAVSDIYLVSADNNFFQLPAFVSICDLIISVETSVIHLASALNVPVVALMRTKNPEWAPWDAENSKLVLCKNRNDWVKDITVDEVVEATKLFAAEKVADFPVVKEQ